MKFDQLSYFLETARHEHIGKASKVLAISPSAICHSIASLEKELGQKLFIKRGKRIFLTTHGKLLMEKADKLLMEAEAIKHELSSDEIQLHGHYRLAASHLLCSKILMPAWCTLQNKNPKLLGELYTRRSSEVMKGIIDGHYDLGVCFSPQEHPDIISEKIYSGQLLIYLNKKHPILKLKNTNKKLAALSNYPAVLPKAFQGIEVCERHPIFDKFNINVSTDCLIDSYEVALEKVSKSFSWGFFPDWIDHLQNGQIKAIWLSKSWDAPYSISIIYSRNRFLSRPMINLVQEIKRQF